MLVKFLPAAGRNVNLIKSIGHRYTCREHIIERLELCCQKSNNYQKSKEKPGSDTFLESSEGPCLHWYVNFGFLVSRVAKNTFLLLKPLSVWYFIMAALAD